MAPGALGRDAGRHHSLVVRESGLVDGSDRQPGRRRDGFGAAGIRDERQRPPVKRPARAQDGRRIVTTTAQPEERHGGGRDTHDRPDHVGGPRGGQERELGPFRAADDADRRSGGPREARQPASRPLDVLQRDLGDRRGEPGNAEVLEREADQAVRNEPGGELLPQASPSPAEDEDPGARRLAGRSEQDAHQSGFTHFPADDHGRLLSSKPDGQRS